MRTAQKKTSHKRVAIKEKAEFVSCHAICKGRLLCDKRFLSIGSMLVGRIRGCYMIISPLSCKRTPLRNRKKQEWKLREARGLNMWKHSPPPLRLGPCPGFVIPFSLQLELICSMVGKSHLWKSQGLLYPPPPRDTHDALCKP